MAGSIVSDLFFLTSNDYKFGEYARLSQALGLPLSRWSGDIQEIQEIDFHAMARQKALEAYKWLLHPVLVDVSGMRLAALDGLPGGLNRQFWDILHNNICEVVHKLGNATATMVVSLALCDGRNIIFADGEVQGELATHESAVSTFHLDRTFIPKGASCVLSELPEAERDAIGPRGLALSDLVARLRGTPTGRELGIR
jgi:XTP/dITP diphosphohydrolase